MLKFINVIDLSGTQVFRDLLHSKEMGPNELFFFNTLEVCAVHNHKVCCCRLPKSFQVRLKGNGRSSQARSPHLDSRISCSPQLYREGLRSSNWLWSCHAGSFLVINSNIKFFIEASVQLTQDVYMIIDKNRNIIKVEKVKIQRDSLSKMSPLARKTAEKTLMEIFSLAL